MENMVNKLFWKDKKVLITGNTGFKGSWCQSLLNFLGADTLGYSDRIPTSPSNFAEIKDDLHLKTIFGDILDAELLKKTINDFNPELIFHMAAQSLVKKSYEDPLETLNANIIGTFNVINECSQNGNSKVLINVTSDKCYENNEENHAFKENDPLGGKDIYSASKACSEIITNSYRESFLNNQNNCLKIASVRAGNVIGGGDWSENRLVPDIIKSLDGKKLVIRNPDATRPWQHVLDPLSGYLRLAEQIFDKENKRLESGWNFGPDDKSTKSVEWILKKSVHFFSDLTYTIEKDLSFKESKYLKLDSSKAIQELGWLPKWKAKDALKKTLAWYANRKCQKFSSSQLVINDIKDYLNEK
tara:strand:+ start:4978 stop:6051 length:1074 start_codon:yes stop_codon:yes gene_type:complete